MLSFSSNQVEGYQSEMIHVSEPRSGHGGGDSGIVDDFISLLQNGGRPAAPKSACLWTAM